MKTIEYITQDKITGEQNSIYLPTFKEHIEDFIEKIGSTSEFYGIDALNTEEYPSCNALRVRNSDIYSINHLAEKIAELDLIERFAFEGVVQKFDYSGIDQTDLINYAHNIKVGKGADAIPATDHVELAEFYMDCNLIPEIAEIKGDAWQWIYDHLDFEQVGKEIEQKSGGIFTNDAFVTFSEPDKLFDGTFKPAKELGCVFNLEIGLKEETEKSQRVTVTLPNRDSKLNGLLFDLGVLSFDELNCYKIESRIPILEPMDFEMWEIFRLDSLAREIENFTDCDKLTTYKAMIDSLKIIDLERIAVASDFMDDFELKTEVRTPVDYAKTKLKVTLPDELIDSLDIAKYGRNIALKDGASLTDYGALIPKDGLTLDQKIDEKLSQEQDVSMQMM
ncbi:MAG: hypothetical protein R3Y09_07745 [Clostridia bacterium]